VAIPAGIAPALYYVVSQADGDAAVPEIHEANNTYPATVWIGPDLAVAVSVPPFAAAGASVTVTDTTRNAGGGAADGSTTRFYLSGDAWLDAADVLLGGRTVAGLGAGASSTASTALTIPPETRAGFHYLLAKADGAAEVAETQEANNTSYAALQVGPDLVVSALAAPLSVVRGAPITVTDTTTNQGAGPAAATSTRFYLSTNAIVDPADAALGARAVADLANGASSSAATAVVIPAATAPGYYYVLARADGDDAVPETNDGNNTRYWYLQVTP
jgi:subtilase family serine protease